MAKRILIIDDDEDILSILNIIFCEEGYEVILFNTGAAPEEIMLQHPDLIILDIRISGYPKTGPQICAEIKAVDALENIPVLLVSAELDVAQLTHTCGANGFVKKPFNINDVLAKVREYIA